MGEVRTRYDVPVLVRRVNESIPRAAIVPFQTPVPEVCDVSRPDVVPCVSELVACAADVDSADDVVPVADDVSNTSVVGSLRSVPLPALVSRGRRLPGMVVLPAPLPPEEFESMPGPTVLDGVSVL